MQKNEYRLKGHESFALREGWLTKGIIAVHEEPTVFSRGKNYGADALGIGTNMAKSVRYWLRCANLTTESIKDGTKLTELGELIYRWDPYLEDIFTLWLVHINIVCNFRQATSWNVFFNDIAVNSFTADELINMMSSKLAEITDVQDLPQRSIKDDCATIRAMYIDSGEEEDPEDKKNSPFAELGLMWSDGKNIGKQSPDTKILDPALILYTMRDKLMYDGALKIDDVVNGHNLPGKLFNLNRIVLNDYLDRLQNEGVITVNRTAGLDMIYANNGAIPTKMGIVRKHYEGTEEP